ncbi:ABC transporter permease [Streptomyces sp. NPDC059894]|uniref:ABC transporter permease n=1 Tax=unclassified Streptomyces TaxID=2593676 RepID=UPI003654431E
MTTLAPATAPSTAGHPGPARRHLRWLLRLHLPGLYVWTALVALLALALLWLWGPLTEAAAESWRQYNACVDYDTCAYYQEPILRYKDVYAYTTVALNALPFLVAAWSGAALVGRELEHGTAHLAWTQGLSPLRWLTLKLAVPAVLITAGTSLLVLLHRLAWTAGRGRIDTADLWYDGPTLYANGPTTVALALAGLAAGALAGLLLRRTLPALLTGLVVTTGLRLLADLAMPHLWPAVTRVTSRNTGYVYDGLEADAGLVTSSGAHIADPGCGPAFDEDCATLYDRLDVTGFYTSYHPESHHWPLQFTTAALLLAVAAALTVAAFVLLKRSTATSHAVGATRTTGATGAARVTRATRATREGTDV